jgi:hypothetical protein
MHTGIALPEGKFATSLLCFQSEYMGGPVPNMYSMEIT